MNFGIFEKFYIYVLIQLLQDAVIIMDDVNYLHNEKGNAGMVTIK